MIVDDVLHLICQYYRITVNPSGWLVTELGPPYCGDHRRRTVFLS